MSNHIFVDLIQCSSRYVSDISNTSTRISVSIPRYKYSKNIYIK